MLSKGEERYNQLVEIFATSQNGLLSFEPDNNDYTLAKANKKIKELIVLLEEMNEEITDLISINRTKRLDSLKELRDQVVNLLSKVEEVNGVGIEVETETGDLYVRVNLEKEVDLSSYNLPNDVRTKVVGKIKVF